MRCSAIGERSSQGSLRKLRPIYGETKTSERCHRSEPRRSGWSRSLAHTRDNMQFSFLVPVVLALSAFATNARAWGTQGHQVITLIAEQQLTPKATEQVKKLLALEPGATLASISTWADEHRNPATAPWHYINFPKNTCTYDAARDCHDGNCVVAAIDKQLEEKRLTALKYVVHLVADVHQPLHAGYGEDRGGNMYQLQAFMRGSNLHAVWDTGLIKNLAVSNEELVTKLGPVSAISRVTQVDARGIAEESCKIVGTIGFYPDRKVGADYVERFTPVMEQRLVTAASRLAGWLNQVLR